MINNNRQAGRRRGRGGQQQRPQGNGPRDNGNRIDNRSRGNAAQLLEKYKSLARDAQQAGDRVNTEYYLQFADHYFRVLAETRSRFEENRTPMQGGANTFQDDEQDYNDEGEPVARVEQPRQNEGQRAEQGQRQDRPDRNADGNRQDGSRDRDGNRAEGNRQDRDGNRSEGRQNNGGQQGYPGERQVEGSRGTQNDRQDRSGGERSYSEDRPRRQDNDQAADRYVRGDRGTRYQEERAPAPQDEIPVEQAAPVAEEAPRGDSPPEAPRRRGRPRREPVAEAAPAFEADRLPPSLMASAVAPAEPAPANDTMGDSGDAEPEEKPRRRRGRPPASEATSA